jgi:hypothetical protein
MGDDYHPHPSFLPSYALPSFLPLRFSPAFFPFVFLSSFLAAEEAFQESQFRSCSHGASSPTPASPSQNLPFEPFLAFFGLPELHLLATVAAQEEGVCCDVCCVHSVVGFQLILSAGL